MATKLRNALAALLLATVLTAQQRQPLLGTVVDAGGVPVAAATVILLEDDADLAGIDPVDRVEVRTDARGRFVASALRGVRYTGLAVGPELDGVVSVALPVRNLGCGGPAELRLQVTAHRRRVELPGLRDWGAFAELRVELRFAGCAGYAIDLPLDADGRIEVPPLTAVAEVVLADRAGGELGRIGVMLDPAQPILMPTPAPVAVRVVDERGEPVAGARVGAMSIQSDTNWSAGCVRNTSRAGSPAVTDPQGRATLRLPTWEDPFTRSPDTLVVFATKADFAEAASGWVCKMPFVGWQVVAEHQDGEIRLPLRAGSPGHGRAFGKELAGRTARVIARGRATQNRDGAVLSYFVPRCYDVAIAADGSFAVPELPPNLSDVRLQLPPIDGRRVVLMPSRDGKLPSVDRADCEPLSLQVLDEQGGPAGDAMVLLVPFQCNDLDLAHAPPIALDRSARAEVLLQRGRWTVLAMTPSTWTSQELESWSAAESVKLVLEPKPSMRVRVVDAEGKPAGAAQFEVGEFRPAPPWPGPGALLRALGWNMLANDLRRAPTDARGEVTLRFLPWPGVQPTAYAWIGDFQRRSDDFRVVPGDDVVTVTLRR